MEKGIFITATGTDIGKTYVSSLWMKELKKKGTSTGYFKPVLSGAQTKNGRMVDSDVHYVCKTAKLLKRPEELVSYAFKMAASPHLAAKMESTPIKKEKIFSDFQRVSKEYDYMVVEGCGGIACPIYLGEETILLTDLVQMLGLEILIVASAELGTINTTILTVAFAQKHKIPIRGIVLNRFQRGNFLHEDNRIQIERLTGIPVIAIVQENAEELEFCIQNLL
ncbi:dethiobiotin synthase [Sinanaerobacter sp. ZZT-01]|uniref:dethiobiotin synthase n=1 Tax=Sinanaerobacter sp. ZZT-01 TaxID=3111540 RepID=UPI002D793EC9|nr:dethiobiotin synthase [Sinanaerobacter sp. ZZT-01]WRR94999.1 dethiobiotin synthase [Sinanaerobacter sp. ZZT-01]